MRNKGTLRERKAYIDMAFLPKVDQRETAKRLGDSERAQILTKELEKERRLAKEAFLLKAISDLDWRGIKLVKPFQAKQTRVRDRGGNIKSTADRAQVFADRCIFLFFHRYIAGIGQLHFHVFSNEPH